MGWSFYCDPSKDKKYLINKLRSPGYLSEGHEMLKSSVVGNNFWFLFKNPDGKIVIGLTLMKGGGANSGWGEKGMDETWGPNEVNCPLSYLDEASPAEGYAIEWREKVRAYHAAKKARPAYAEDQVWQSPYENRQYRLYHKRAGSLKGWYCKEVGGNDTLYRVGYRQLATWSFVSN